MTDYKETINHLTNIRLIPNNNYLAIKGFTEPFNNSVEFLTGLGAILVHPILNSAYSCYHAAEALWAMLRAVGNFLIAKPGYTVDALQDAGFHLALSIALAVMAPVNILHNSVALVTKTLSSWLTGTENSDNLSPLSVTEAFSKSYKQHERLLPSTAYFKSSRFFATYEDGLEVLGQAVTPITAAVETGFYSLSHTLYAAWYAINCIANLLICKPTHALEDAREVSVHLSLALALAVMTPINALVETIAFGTRIGATWVDAFKSGEVDASADSQLACN